MLADTLQVPIDLCGVVGSQGILQIRPAEFIRPIKDQGSVCEGRTLFLASVQRKLVTVLEPQNTVCPEFCLDLLEILSSAGLCDWVSDR